MFLEVRRQIKTKRLNPRKRKLRWHHGIFACSTQLCVCRAAYCTQRSSYIEAASFTHDLGQSQALGPPIFALSEFLLSLDQPLRAPQWPEFEKVCGPPAADAREESVFRPNVGLKHLASRAKHLSCANRAWCIQRKEPPRHP